MSESKASAPYIAFSTFTTALDNIKGNGVPNIIDRHSFPSFSGAALTGTLSALRFFGLIDGDGRPSDTLRDLAVDEEGRKKIIRSLLESHYQNLIAIDLTRATPTQFDSEFSGEIYNVTGDTRVKSKTFFIKAAQYAGLPLSPLLTKKARATGPRKARKAKVASNGGSADNVTHTAPPINSRSDSKTSQEFLFEILNPEGMSPEEQAAVWTLLQYVKKQQLSKVLP